MSGRSLELDEVATLPQLGGCADHRTDVHAAEPSLRYRFDEF